MRYVDPHLNYVISENIRGLRHENGLRQIDLAARWGLHVETIKDIERARRRVRLHETPALCRALGCTIDDLLEP